MIKEIVRKYRSHELDESIDESGAGGFWDLAGSIIRNHIDSDTMPIIDVMQEDIYSTLTTLYREIIQ